MEKRVEIFTSEDDFDLKSMINNFLKRTSGKLHEVSFSMSQSSQDDFISTTFGACIIYTPEFIEDENE